MKKICFTLFSLVKKNYNLNIIFVFKKRCFHSLKNNIKDQNFLVKNTNSNLIIL